MKIIKERHFEIKQKAFFIKGMMEFDYQYFIDEINKGVIIEGNKTYKTNIVGEMTPWDYFNNDLKFNQILSNILDYADDILTLPSIKLQSSWGFKQHKFSYTKNHDHVPAHLSIAIYLNHHPQELVFQDINEVVKAEPGSFAIFSSELKHGCKRNPIDDFKYGLSANFHHRLYY